MKNIKAYIVGIILVALALIPPVNFAVRAPSEYWPWFVVMAGFAGFYTLFIKTDFIIKFVAISGFLNCFFSKVPYVSFTSYILLILGCYFYILCRSVKNYDPIFNMLKCLMIFVGFMLVIQCFGGDKLLNVWREFSRDGNYCFGVTGHRMQSASFAVILGAALMPTGSYNSFFPMVTSIICNSVGAFLSASIGIIALLRNRLHKEDLAGIGFIMALIFSAWLVTSGKFHANTIKDGGRLAVWLRTLSMSFEHPFVGWGMGTFKGLFPALGGINTIPWKQAHNCWIQLIFEFGYIFTLAIYSYFLYLIVQLGRLRKRTIFRDKSFQCIAGLIMIFVNMLFHFPTRMTPTVLIIIFFLAYCKGVIDHGRVKN